MFTDVRVETLSPPEKGTISSVCEMYSACCVFLVMFESLFLRLNYHHRQQKLWQALVIWIAQQVVSNHMLPEVECCQMPLLLDSPRRFGNRARAVFKRCLSFSNDTKCYIVTLLMDDAVLVIRPSITGFGCLLLRVSIYRLQTAHYAHSTSTSGPPLP